MSINTNPNLADLYPYRIVSTDTNGVLSFAAREKKWWWYLDLHGEPLYLVSNACGTCEAIYKRVRDLETPITPQQLSQQLADGLTIVTEEILATVLPLLPKGDYIVGLIEVRPTRMVASLSDAIGCEADFFWGEVFAQDTQGSRYELVLPSLPESALQAERVAAYRSRLERGEAPTALALSVLDERTVSGRYHEEALVHILLDGHHKVMAASQLGRPITLLSFLKETARTGISTVSHVTRDEFSRRIAERGDR